MTTDAPPALSTGPLADSLRRNRDAFNARFALAQRGGARIDPARFLHHLATVVDPILRPIAEHFAERTDPAAIALYDLSLELFAASLLGPGARSPAVTSVWQRLLPAIPRLLARDTRHLAATLSNAAHNLAQIESARPDDFVTRMLAIAPRAGDSAALLDAGKVAAWLAGCPHYRGAAIEVARTLPPDLLSPLLFDSDLPPAELVTALNTLATHRWLSPREALAGPVPTRLRITQVAGHFRGFGGPFLRPPTVATRGPQLFISDNHFLWTLIADFTGCLFHRAATGGLSPATPVGVARLAPSGQLDWDSASARFPQLANFNSAAFDGQTLAVTLPTSHHVFLIGRG